MPQRGWLAFNASAAAQNSPRTILHKEEKARITGLGVKFLSLLALWLIISASALTAQSWPPAGMAGSGTEAAPWEIESHQHLKALADYINAGNGDETVGKYYKLMNDIDLSSYAEGEGWTPIGIEEWDDETEEIITTAVFQGNLNGNGKTVNNLTINRPTEYMVGLFKITCEATIENLGLVNCNVTGNGCAGGLVGLNYYYSTIVNCYATGTLHNNSSASGGLVGHNAYGSSIKNCYSTVSVSGTQNGGCLVGANTAYSIIENCYATGNVEGIHQVGGLAGQNYWGGIIKNSYATGNVEATGSQIGGIVGSVYQSTIENCYATGSVTGNGYNTAYNMGIGGIVGSNNESTIKNCVAANSSITATNSAGVINRITGENTSSSTSNNYASVDMVVIKNGVPQTITPDLNGNDGADATIAQLQSVAFYTTPENWEANQSWDFTVWNVCDGEDMFPFLRWQGIYCEGELIPVDDIIDVPETAMSGIALTLTASVVPFNASNSTIIWSVENAGTTGAYITSGNILNTTAEGTVQIKASIEDGTAIGTPFVKLFNIEVSEAFCGGDGTEDDPFMICSPQGLDAIRYMLDKHYILMNDLDLTDFISENNPILGWEPIGENEHNAFSGSLNGNGHKIAGFTINRPTAINIGLFGYMTSATISNLGIENCNIVGNERVGALTGTSSYGIIENCYVTGNIEGNADYVGGFTGVNWGTIKNCYVSIEIIGYGYVGGLAGQSDGTIENSLAMGSVTGNNFVGGIAGRMVYADSGTIKNCVAANYSLNAASNFGRIVYYGGSHLSNNYALETMLVNGSTVSSSDHASMAGADASIETMQLETFYTTVSFWHENAWDFTVWDICNAKTFPWLKWENIDCDGMFIPVTNITDVPSGVTVNVPLPITATVVPYNAYYQTIVWSVENAGTTGAAIAGNLFTATAAGTAQIKATIENGTAIGTPYEQLFEIVVNPVTYTITATAGANGSIDPSGAIIVEEGDSQTFTFTPIANYQIEQVLINGTNNPVAVENGYHTFENVTQNNTIHVTFGHVGIDINTYGRTSPDVYPNPTSGVFFVRHCGLDPQSPQNKGMLKQVQHDAALDIYDITGRIVHREPCTVHRATVEIDITHLANGIYFIKINNETIKIVKN